MKGCLLKHEIVPLFWRQHDLKASALKMIINTLYSTIDFSLPYSLTCHLHLRCLYVYIYFFLHYHNSLSTFVLIVNLIVPLKSVLMSYVPCSHHIFQIETKLNCVYPIERDIQLS